MLEVGIQDFGVVKDLHWVGLLIVDLIIEETLIIIEEFYKVVTY